MAEDQSVAEFFNIMRAAFEPIARVCFIALVGWVLAWDRVGLLTPDKRAFLSQINVQVFLPSFLFMRLLRATSIQTISEWWALPLFVGFNLLFGLIAGYVLCLMLGKKRVPMSQRGIVLAVSSVGNCGVLPLALVDSACAPSVREKMGFTVMEECVEQGQAMVAFGLWMCTIGVWVLGTFLLSPPKEWADDPRHRDDSKYERFDRDDDSAEKFSSSGQQGKEEAVPQDGTPRRVENSTGIQGQSMDILAEPGPSALNDSQSSDQKQAHRLHAFSGSQPNGVAGEVGSTESEIGHVGNGVAENGHAKDHQGNGYTGGIVSELHVQAGNGKLQVESAGQRGSARTSSFKGDGKIRSNEMVDGCAKNGVEKESPGNFGGYADSALGIYARKAKVLVIRVVRGIKPPLAAVALGIFLGSIPGVKNLFVGDRAPLASVASTLDVLGAAFLSAMLLVLGGNMKVTKTGPSGLHLTAVYGTVIARLVVLPFTGLGLLKLFSAMGIMPEDPLLRFVIVLQFTAPVAANLGTAATIAGYGQAEVSQVALPMYLCAVPICTFLIMYFLSLDL